MSESGKDNPDSESEDSRAKILNSLISVFASGENAVQANFYVWSRNGKMIDEHQTGFHHDPMGGIDIRELFVHHPDIEEGWEIAMGGNSFAWVSRRGKNFLLNGFVPFCVFEKHRPTYIMGVGFVIPPDALNWLDSRGITLSKSID